VVSKEFIDSLVLTEQIWSNFIDPHRSDAKADLKEFFSHITNLPDVLRSHIYAQDRTVIWSNNQNFIGTKLGPNPELEESFAGALTVELSSIGGDDKIEHVDFPSEAIGSQVIEFYIPIRGVADGSVVGVVELYKKPDALFAAIDEGKRLLWISIIGSGLLLYAALFWIVRRANDVIQEQHERLVESETMVAMGEMVSAVAHSIRNPLSSIRTSAELALEEDLEGARESATDIISEADRLEHWIRGLLHDVSAGCAPYPIQTEKANINEVLQDTLQVFATEMDQNQVHLHVGVQEPLPPVNCNTTTLTQMFSSIVANALEAMSSEGQLNVTTKLDVSQRNVVVKFNDSGAELPLEVVEKVFQPCFSTKKSGLGLGLALTRRMVTRCGGSIDFSSVKGQGTSVKIVLPRAVEEAR
jgi:signal transduction histidine kinase